MIELTVRLVPFAKDALGKCAGMIGVRGGEQTTVNSRQLKTKNKDAESDFNAEIAEDAEYAKFGMEIEAVGFFTTEGTEGTEVGARGTSFIAGSGAGELPFEVEVGAAERSREARMAASARAGSILPLLPYLGL